MIAELDETKKVVPERDEDFASNDEKASNEASAIAEGNYHDQERRQAETQTIIEGNRNRKANRRLRWRYARLVFRYLLGYSCAVFLLLVLSGFGVLGFRLPDQVLSLLVGSTAAAAIGLVYAVTNGLFNEISK